MASAASFCGVILAAGESSRMGRDKALLPWPPRTIARPAPGPLVEDRNLLESPGVQVSGFGETFLSAHISLLDDYTQLLLVVAGHNAEALSAVVYTRGASLVVNREPERGQFSSLQVGLREVLNRGRDAAIVSLVDRPPASARTLERLRTAFDGLYAKGKWAVIPEFEGRHGHPILVGREMIEAFLKAPPTATARDVEHSLQDRLEYVAVDDPLVTVNINTPEDYEQLVLHAKNSASISSS